MKTNQVLVKLHGFSLTELENMLPWERIVYIDIISNQLKEEAETEMFAKNQARDMMSLRGR